MGKLSTPLLLLSIIASEATMDKMTSLPEVVQSVLAQSGAFAEDLMPPKELEAGWTERDYKAHCLPEGAGPYDHLTEEDWVEWERQRNEDEAHGPWCDYCHRDSGCDGDHGDEMRDGFLLRKGPAFSPLTVAPPIAPVQQVMAQAQPQPEPQAQPQPEAQPNCGPTLKCAWPDLCRCGWQFHPAHRMLEFRDGTAKWDSATERWTWTSTSTSYSSTWSRHFPYQAEPEAQPEHQQVLNYIEEVDAWSKDVARLIAESKAIREAPLSAFAELAHQEDDDTIPEVDIEAA